jgi:cell wall-associated NlpC family hydrolase
MGRASSEDSHGFIDTQAEYPAMAALAAPGDPVPPTRVEMEAAAAAVSARAAELQRVQDRVAWDLKQVVQALVAGQLAAVETGRSRRDALAGALAAARARQDAMKAASQAALATAAAAGESGAAGRGYRAGSAGLASGASASQGDAAANWAMSQLGKPYQWGAAGPDTYDCSGLAMQAWTQAGVHLGHWTGVQWGSGPHVPLNQLHRGDLLFYASNVRGRPDRRHPPRGLASIRLASGPGDLKRREALRDRHELDRVDVDVRGQRG